MQAWQTEGGWLNVKKMTRIYGGAQPHLHDTTIKQQQGYLGPFIRILEPGDMQSMVFKVSDIGPFWMTGQDREAKHHDIVIEGGNSLTKIQEVRTYDSSTTAWHNSKRKQM